MPSEPAAAQPRTAADGIAFRMRLESPSRLEGFSDAVFGFAVTLLVVSLEVPRTFDELWRTLRGFPAFAVSFALLFVIWHAQYRWFRRYGLHDGPSLVLNAILLFLVLLFTYPLKFVFSLTIGGLLGQPMGIPLAGGTFLPPIRPEQIVPMMTVYGLGYVAVFAIFALLHAHALRCAGLLGLDALERFDTRFALRESVINCCIGLASIAIVVATHNGFLSGMTYVLIGPALTLHGALAGPRRRPLDAAARASFSGDAL